MVPAEKGTTSLKKTRKPQPRYALHRSLPNFVLQPKKTTKLKPITSCSRHFWEPYKLPLPKWLPSLIAFPTWRCKKHQPQSCLIPWTRTPTIAQDDGNQNPRLCWFNFYEQQRTSHSRFANWLLCIQICHFQLPPLLLLNLQPTTEAAVTSPEPSSSPGFTYLYLPTRARMPFKEMRSSLRDLYFNSGSIVDIHYPAKNVVALLIHNDYHSTAINILKQNDLTPISSFDPLNTDNLADPKFKEATHEERSIQIRNIYEN